MQDVIFLSISWTLNLEAEASKVLPVSDLCKKSQQIQNLPVSLQVNIYTLLVSQNLKYFLLLGLINRPNGRKIGLLLPCLARTKFGMEKDPSS